METVEVTSKVWRNIVQMLTDRGYTPDEAHLSNKGGLLDMKFTEDSETTWSNRLVLYLLVEQPKLKNGKFTALLKKYENSEFTHMIIVSSKKEISTISDIIRNCKITIQCINYSFFTCNVMRHSIQPKIRLVDYSEVSIYGPLEAFPKVLLSDPVVVYNGYRSGDIIEYRREKDLYYRVVV